MAEGIVYLDVDDEITSAASRIRTSAGTKVALVVPYGSRIATSRMNFRLLSREAIVSNHRLSIVSGDAAARSLAASAGLPVFGTVAEYESSLSSGPAGGSVSGPSAAAAAAPTGTPSPLTVSDTVVKPPEPVDADVPVRKSQLPRRPVPEQRRASAPIAAQRAADDDGSEPSDDDDADAGGRRGGIRTPVVAAIGLVTLALIVAGVAAYLFLPSATIALTPRREAIGPLQLTVLADPEATAPDPVGLTVPADRLELPVEAGRTFKTTGTKVTETAPRGSVAFTNSGPPSSNTVPAGSIVSTEGGIRFRTLSTL